jgi:hypothetical protein
MFGTIRKHQKWLWIVIITVIIISFVFFFSPATSQMGGRSSSGLIINGRSFTPAEVRQAQIDVTMAIRLQQRVWPSQSDYNRMEQQIKQRLVVLGKLKDMNIRASDEAVAQHMAQLFRNQGSAGFDLQAYQSFVKNELPRGGVSEKDMIEFFRNDLGVVHMSSLLGLSGRLLTPRVAEMYYQWENEEYTGEITFLSLSNYLPKVTLKAEDVGQYFTNNQSQYWSKDQVRLAYVSFAHTNHLTEADKQLAARTNLAAELDTMYLQRNTNDFVGLDGKVLSPDEAKARLKEDERKGIARNIARTNATIFAQEFFAMDAGNGANLTTTAIANLGKLASNKGLKVVETEPFADDDSGLPASVTRTAFDLREDQPIAPLPVSGPEAVYVLVLKQRIPSAPQTLEAVKERVTVDYKRRKAEELMRQAGSEFVDKATEGLAKGKTFKALCEEASLRSVELTPFAMPSTNMPPEVTKHVSAPFLARKARELKAGGVSSYSSGRDESGFVFHLKSRTPVSTEKTRTALPAYLTNLRDRQQDQAANAWFMREFSRAMPPTK